MTIVVLAVFEVLAITAVGLRIWARALKRTPYCLNDYAIFVALVRSFRLNGPLYTDLQIDLHQRICWGFHCRSVVLSYNAGGLLIVL